MIRLTPASRRRLILATALFLVGAACGGLAAAGIYSKGGPRPVATRVAARVGLRLPPDHDLSNLTRSHWDTRDIIIRLQSSEAPAGSILLLGDSIVEGYRADRLAVDGRECVVVNAGFAGIGVRELRPHLEAALAETQPRFVILSVGVNDAWADADVDAWAQAYERLVEEISRRKVTLVALTIMPPEPGFPNVTKSPDTVAAFNRVIRAVAARHGVLVADVAAGAAGATERVRNTVDGLHPTGPFYHKLESRWFAPAIRSAEAVRGEACVSES